MQTGCRFRFALSIALAVGLLTLAGIATITYFLVTTCTLVCNSTPLALLATSTASKLSCVGFGTRALQLSISTNEQSRALFHDVLGADGNPSAVWAGFVWGASSARLGKCSFLHATDCGLQEWLATFQVGGRSLCIHPQGYRVSVMPKQAREQQCSRQQWIEWPDRRVYRVVFVSSAAEAAAAAFALLPGMSDCRGGGFTFVGHNPMRQMPTICMCSVTTSPQSCVSPCYAADCEQGLVAISRLANTSSSAAAAEWPSVTTFYSSSNNLDDQREALFAAASGTTRLNPAGVQALLAASGAALASNTSILAVCGCCQHCSTLSTLLLCLPECMLRGAIVTGCCIYPTCLAEGIQGLSSMHLQLPIPSYVCAVLRRCQLLLHAATSPLMAPSWESLVAAAQGDAACCVARVLYEWQKLP